MPQTTNDQGQALALQVEPTGRVAHVDRGERECFGAALPQLARIVGPAARVIDCGAFAGNWLQSLIGAFERPKAGLTITNTSDPRNGHAPHDYVGTAQITHITHDILIEGWPLDANGAGKTLVTLSGGAFGFLNQKQAFAFLENASQSLNSGDFVALTLEQSRDAAILETLYGDYLGQLITTTLSKVGKINGLEARSFFTPALNAMTFGAMARANASYDLETGSHKFEAGDWIEGGMIQFFDLSADQEFHPDFTKRDLWLSSDGAIGIVLLQKL